MINIREVSKLYSSEEKVVSFRHADSQGLGRIAHQLGVFKRQIHADYQDDHLLNDQLMVFKRMFWKMISSFKLYSSVLNEDNQKELIQAFKSIKRTFPQLYTDLIQDMAKDFRTVISTDDNYMMNELLNILQSHTVNKKVAIVTKRSLSEQEKKNVMMDITIEQYLMFFTETTYRNTLQTFDVVIVIGNPDYFCPYISNTFKGNQTIFLAYDFLKNSLVKKPILSRLEELNPVNDLYTHIRIEKGKTVSQSEIFDEKEDFSMAVERFLEKQATANGHVSQSLVSATMLYLENNRFIFAPKDTKVRRFDPNADPAITQTSVEDIEPDDYMVIRNDSDSKLIAEVADQYVLKEQAALHREKQVEWKEKLSAFIVHVGLRQGSSRLIKKHKVTNATQPSLKGWMSEHTIKPRQLPELLIALGYSTEEADQMNRMMSTINSAHQKAGRIIVQKLMKELSADISIHLEEHGYYTFVSEEFDGASFNIERVALIHSGEYKVHPHHLMKTMNVRMMTEK